MKNWRKKKMSRALVKNTPELYLYIYVKHVITRNHLTHGCLLTFLALDSLLSLLERLNTIWSHENKMPNHLQLSVYFDFDETRLFLLNLSIQLIADTLFFWKLNCLHFFFFFSMRIAYVLLNFTKLTLLWVSIQNSTFACTMMTNELC